MKSLAQCLRSVVQRSTRPVIIGSAAVAAACLVGAAAAARTGYVPPHQLGIVRCLNGGIMQVYPPRSMAPTSPTDFRNPEMVRWKPYLYGYNTADGLWHLVATRSWYRAFTSSYGYYQNPLSGAWTSTTNYQGQVLFVPFTGLGVGQYRIKNYLTWGWRPGHTYFHWSKTACTFS